MIVMSWRIMSKSETARNSKRIINNKNENHEKNYISNGTYLLLQHLCKSAV